jgi:hypothetical protein
MNRKHLKWRVWPVLVLAASLSPYLPAAGAETAQEAKQAGPDMAPVSWQSPARLHHVVGREKGDLTIGAEGIEFRSGKGRTIKLSYLEVQSFLLSPHSLNIETYQNRKRHLPGIERYKFEFANTVPPEVAAELSKEVHRPSQNAVPDPAAQGIVIPAHHRTVRGGTNGTLRIRDGGIDYVTDVAGDSRSWRWADLQTLSDPDPYHLFVFGYRDTYTFDLKEPLPQSLFYRLIDAVDAHSAVMPDKRPDVHAPKSSDGDGQGAGNE